MIKSLYYSLKIDTYYAVNSFIFSLRELPIFRDLFTEDSYKDSFFKNILGIFGFISSLFRIFFLKILYFVLLSFLAKYLSKDNMTFYHVLFFFSILGMFINNRLLNVSMKKYLCVILFNMDAKTYLLSNLLFVTITNLAFNSICLFIFGDSFELNIIFVGLLLFFRIIGEAFNIYYYRKHESFWYDNLSLYFSVLILFLLCSLTPFIGLIINKEILILCSIVIIILGIISFIYINKVNDYKLLFKNLNTIENILNNKTDNNEQNLLKVKDSDIKIHSKSISKKTGYAYFNSLFFERHKSMLLKSSINISAIILGIYICIGFLIFYDSSFTEYVKYFYDNKVATFVLIMCFINRSNVVTQAMFYNCDHAMLKYNFYRNPKVLVGLFRMRLATLIRVNLLPSLVIAIGNSVLLMLIGNLELLNHIGLFLFIIALSVFFSVHYLIIYYLLQPFNEYMQMKSLPYLLIYSFTFIFSFEISDMIIYGVDFLFISVLLCIIYVIIALKLVEKFAPKTFKL